MAIFPGFEGKSRAASESIAYSFPGISGMKGRPPTETKMFLAVYNFPSTSTVCGSTICALQKKYHRKININTRSFFSITKLFM
jgi:hypothetical protein